MKYDYVEKAITVTRREFIGMLGIAAAMLWTGAFAVTDLVADRNKYIRMRTAGLYKDDEKQAVRQSHNNRSLMKMYETWAGKPMGHLAEELFHTRYYDRTVL